MCFGNAKATIDEAIRFRITCPNSNIDESIVRLSNDATTEFDPMWDAWKMFTTNDMIPSLYSKSSNDDDLAINAIPTMSKDSSLLIYVRARLTSGTYNLTSEQLGDFPPDLKIALKDLETGLIYELNEDIDFNFNVIANPNDMARFELFYSTQATLNINENELSLLNEGCFDWNYTITNISNTFSFTASTFNQEIIDTSLTNDDYQVLITDNYGLIDTLFFTIDVEIEEDTTVLVENDLPVADDESINAGTDFLNLEQGKDDTQAPYIYNNGFDYVLNLNSVNATQITIYSMNGQMIQNLNENSDKIILTKPEVPGLYLILINSENETSSSLKWLVQ